MNKIAVAVDTKIAELEQQAARMELAVGNAAAAVHRSAGDKRVRFEGEMQWMMTLSQCLKVASRATVGEFDQTKATLLAKEKELRDEHAKYAGWSRYYLVTNVNGHIHSSTRCSTCTYTTRFAWLTALSGATEAEAVEAEGGRLCTVCFPTAPVEWTEGYAKKSKVEAAAARDAKAVAKAEKEAKKAAFWAERHFGVRFTRTDGSVFFHNDYDWNHGHKGMTRKSAIRDAASSNAINDAYGTAVAVDMLTGEEIK